MQSLRKMIDTVGGALGAAQNDRVAARAASVRAMFKDAIIHCYRDAAPAVLSHVNAVYILKDDDDPERKTLAVYMDDANFRSDVHARQYFIILWLKERYGETIDEFRTYSARARMRQRHAYHPQDGTAEKPEEEPTMRPLTPDDERTLASWGSDIDDLTLRNAFLKAARSGIERWG